MLRRTGFFFFQAEDGIRDLVRSRGLGDVYKRQHGRGTGRHRAMVDQADAAPALRLQHAHQVGVRHRCLLYTSDAADERSSVDLGGRRIIKKKNNNNRSSHASLQINTHL